MRHTTARLALPLAVSMAVLAACGGSGETSSAAPGPDPAAGPSGGVDTEAELYDRLPQEIKDAGEIVFAGDSHPPYRTVGADGQTVTGIDADLQAALSEVLGVPIRTEITTGLPAMLSGMLSGRYDAFNGPVRTTPEREAEFDAVVWMTTVTSYVVPEGSDAGIEDSGDLCGKTVAGTEGSVTQEMVTRLSQWCEGQGEGPVEFTGLADTNATILAVDAGRVDAAAVTEAAAIDIVSASEDYYYVSQTEDQGAGVDQMALLTPKSNELGPVVFEAFQVLFENGDYERVMEEWNLQDVTIDEPLLNPATEQ
ncbi:transporter substrate-binding domain-containing protein [Geodermatophilus nigrescens]|uniref:Amino acid ABC transporter substrate-binding protein, PAAT family n=1 Tax=Geodermatophilus nigrescens TaxID=1070870 RepID=A0A1M5HI51_9ACTN|nr:transporter substrate-binding domain-containing protein [Geodermatophilus nigrescens]SHG15649.1 amino acid ABC transporter substrate-binding protein, PAAT family [Geodermatophilus nigrescens]